MGSYSKIYEQIIEIFKKLESILIFLSFFMKILCQIEEPPLPLSKQSPPFSLTPPFLERVFHPDPHFQIRRKQPTLCKGGVRTMP